MLRTRTRRPTQNDVARLAAVSQPVVSYVLSGDPDAPVSAETRARVLAAVEELGYVPDRTARNLRRRRTFTLAGVIPDITNPFYPAFERGVQDVAEAHGLTLITYHTDGRAAMVLAGTGVARSRSHTKVTHAAKPYTAAVMSMVTGTNSDAGRPAACACSTQARLRPRASMPPT